MQRVHWVKDRQNRCDIYRDIDVNVLDNRLGPFTFASGAVVLDFADDTQNQHQQNRGAVHRIHDQPGHRRRIDILVNCRGKDHMDACRDTHHHDVERNEAQDYDSHIV